MKSFRIAYPCLVVVLVLWTTGTQDMNGGMPSMRDTATQVSFGLEEVVDYILEPIGIY